MSRAQTICGTLPGKPEFQTHFRGNTTRVVRRSSGATFPAATLRRRIAQLARGVTCRAERVAPFGPSSRRACRYQGGGSARAGCAGRCRPANVPRDFAKVCADLLRNSLVSFSCFRDW